MTAPHITGRRALFRTACLVLALECLAEVRRDDPAADPAPQEPGHHGDAGVMS